MRTNADMSREAVTHRLRQMEGLWLLSKALSSAKLTNKYDSKKTRGMEIQESIRRVLVNDWDPVGISDVPECRGEYDAYIAPIYRILVGSRLEEDLVDALRRIEEEEIGLRSARTEVLLPVAKKLLELNLRLNLEDL